VTDTSTDEQTGTDDPTVAPQVPAKSSPEPTSGEQPPTDDEVQDDRSAEADEVAGPAGSGTAATAADAATTEVADEDEAVDEAADDPEDSDEDGPSDPLDVEGEIAADYLEELLDIADLDGDIDTYVESGRAHVSVVTEADVLVGKDGEVLDALQELARLAVVTETGHRSRLMLDVAGHRDQRRTELVALATEAIDEARSSGEQVRLTPMNAFERKVVHDAVAAAGLTSESEGEDPQRRVVVIP